ncbi:MAG: DMT family transporter [Bacteroidetes bacterium]|jgi:drug/metabolite transporter (DMT)-like permease|nr:DMT family transporter [Bacteroidota bacterium]MBK8329110.1 DMT family transporter [Bacteroidota bacterium]MBK9300974.1 DMT family transporter [Bacteroidota bacterium]MBK9480670.1 DMT family transporter [Bacteroidota bacterium]
MNSLAKNKHFLIVGISLSMLIWGMSWPSAKVLSHYGKPLEIALIRFVFTFISLFVLLHVLKVKLSIQTKGLPSLLIASVLIALYSMLFFTGILKGMPGAGGVLVTTMTPIVSYMLALIIQKRKPSGKELIGLLIGLLAGCILLSIWNHASQILQSGNLFFILSTLVWAILSRITALSFKYGSPLAFSLWMYLLCILILTCFVDLQSIKQLLIKGDTMFWGNMLFNGIVNTGIATTFFFYATSKIGAEKTSSFIYIVPFAAAISSYIAIGEIIQWNTIVGGLLGIVAVWVINKKIKN